MANNDDKLSQSSKSQKSHKDDMQSPDQINNGSPTPLQEEFID